MPELPEVETIKRGLVPHLEGQRFVEVICRRPNLRYPLPEHFAERLQGRKVLRLSRRAKYMLWELEGDESLVIHLGMSGKILYHSELPNHFNVHDHVRFYLENGTALTFNDVRRFGFMGLVTTSVMTSHPWFVRLGPEPLEAEWNADYAFAESRGRARPLKLWLMDQEIIVGVGNIYASEALFRAKLSPFMPVKNLTKKEAERLAQGVKEVLQDALASGGSTLRDYVRSSGDVGGFQHYFAVYGKEGRPCQACGQVLQAVLQGGRSTYFCTKCQKVTSQSISLLESRRRQGHPQA